MTSNPAFRYEVRMQVNGIELYVEDSGEGIPLLLLHGWPDSGRLWRHQVPALQDAGFRTVVPDQRGFGRSDKPEAVDAYATSVLVADVVALLDALGLARVHVVGHDWGAFVAWMVASFAPERVDRLVVLSVPHPLAPRTLRQREMAWYQLFFQFPDVAEQWLQHDDWALLRELLRDDGDIEQYLSDLARPGALTASLNWYRAILAPKPPGPPPSLPPVQASTMGVWSRGDHYLDGARMQLSSSYVAGEWRYEELDGSHWIPLDQPKQLTALLLEWLGR